MSENHQLLSQLEELLRQKKSKSFYAEKLGITEEEVNELLKELRTNNKEPFIFDSSTKKVNIEKGTMESTILTTFEPKNDIELAKLHKIDLNSYIISNYWTKQLSNGKFTSSILCKRKKAGDFTIDDFKKVITGYTPKLPTITKYSTSIEKAHVNVEISLSDFHLAKRHLEGDNLPADRATRYFNIAQDLVKKVTSVYNTDTVVLPISNDFFHTDNYQNQTTNGTPQDIIMDYSSEYELGFKILADTINMLRQYASNVEVVLVQGNHDRTKSFYLAHALEVYFKDALDVKFNREHGVVKAVVLGNTFIGYHHGNCKIEDLPLLFATHPEYSSLFGSSVYREVHTGDKHHYMAKEVKGVRIQQMPSLSGTDRWHADNNYVHSVRAALALVYDYKQGKCAEFESRI